MKLYPVSLSMLLTLAVVLLLVPDERAVGCAAAPPFGATVRIADESAIIIWDASSKTEHFIRRATFSSSAHDFGFLVPTPTKPELAEAEDDAFKAQGDVDGWRLTGAEDDSGGRWEHPVAVQPKRGDVRQLAAVEQLVTAGVFDAAVEGEEHHVLLQASTISSQRLDCRSAHLRFRMRHEEHRTRSDRTRNC
jgi:hypothetical protein